MAWILVLEFVMRLIKCIKDSGVFGEIESIYFDTECVVSTMETARVLLIRVWAMELVVIEPDWNVFNLTGRILCDFVMVWFIKQFFTCIDALAHKSTYKRYIKRQKTKWNFWSLMPQHREVIQTEWWYWNTIAHYLMLSKSAILLE